MRINRICLKNSASRLMLLIAAFLLISPGAFAFGQEDIIDEAGELREEAYEQRETIEKAEEEEGLNVKEIIFEHLGDGYGWEVPFSHVYRIPLPVILRAEDGTWHSFSSARLTKLEEEVNPKTGEIHMVAMPQIVHIDKPDGRHYEFILASFGKHKHKVVQIFELDSIQKAQVKAEAIKEDPKLVEADWDKAEYILDGYIGFQGKFYREYKPHDVSITKNVLAMLIAAVVLTLMVMSVVWWYSRKGMKAPRKGLGFLEMLIDFIYTGVIKSTLGDRAKKYAPFLLTAFFFILIMNLFGLIVIFPGGANLTGNIAITLVLAIMVFVITNINGNKHYWKEIFWPDVPLFLKFPIPIMQFIEIFGIFTKPAALCVRLFANMMGGHMIVITLTLLIFIFAAFGAIAAGGSVFVSVIFSIFMLLLDVLVSFIQAYVFTLLATIFISMSTEKHHEGHDKHEDQPAESTTPQAAETSANPN